MIIEMCHSTYNTNSLVYSNVIGVLVSLVLPILRLL